MAPKRRKKKRVGNPIPNKIRVQIHRKYKKIYKQNIEGIQVILNNQTNHNTTIQNDSNNSTKLTLKQDLVDWINKCRIGKRAVNDLLSKLRSSGAQLPKDYRTLLKTQTKYEILKISDGDYYYHGIEKSLRNMFQKLDRHFEISLSFNVDGLPLARSSRNTFWPILGSIFGKVDLFFTNRNHFLINVTHFRLYRNVACKAICCRRLVRLWKA